MKTTKNLVILLFVSFLLTITINLAVVATVEPLRLPNTFGDHMVLQRELPVVIWGWADAGMEVTVTFGEQTKSVEADSAGRWRIQLLPLQASAKAAKLKVQAGDESIEYERHRTGNSQCRQSPHSSH